MSFNWPDNPVLAGITRGGLLESVHRGSFAVMSSDGTPALTVGDVKRPVYARSAIKPLQALPLLESGAADQFGLTDAQIALACASHNGEPRHVELIGRWLASIGLDDSDLECAAHWPLHQESTRHLAAQAKKPVNACNNCSGKHTGFLTTAVHMQEPTQGYINYDHPVQQRLRATLSALTGNTLDDAPTGIDGCGIPVIGMSLTSMALAMARFGDADGSLAGERVDSAKRIFHACVTEPHMVAGDGRFCTEAMVACDGQVLVKTGAEGVFCVAFPQRRLGLALKIDDGATRAAETVTATIIERLFDDGALTTRLESWVRRPVHNVAKVEVGMQTAVGNWLGSLPRL